MSSRSHWGVVGSVLVFLALFLPIFPRCLYNLCPTLCQVPVTESGWEQSTRPFSVLLICIAFIIPWTEVGHPPQRPGCLHYYLYSWLQDACPCWWQSSTQSAMSPCLRLSSSNVTILPQPSFRMWWWRGASSPSARTRSLTTTLHVSDPHFWQFLEVLGTLSRRVLELFKDHKSLGGEITKITKYRLPIHLYR